MRKNRIKGYWKLLMSLLVIASMPFAVGTAQARPENTVTSIAVLSTSAGKVTSNCLITETDAPRTVLLGEVDLENLSPVEIPFWLLSTGKDAKLKLNWYISEQVPEEYFKVSLKAKGGSEEEAKALVPDTEIELLKDIRQDLTLCLEPTESARGNVHDEMLVNVYVTAGDIMKGTFQVVLPEVKAEEPTEPEEPQEPEEPTEPQENKNTR